MSNEILQAIEQLRIQAQALRIKAHALNRGTKARALYVRAALEIERAINHLEHYWSMM